MFRIDADAFCRALRIAASELSGELPTISITLKTSLLISHPLIAYYRQSKRSSRRTRILNPNLNDGCTGRAPFFSFVFCPPQFPIGIVYRG
jgi:hypothetical protein